MTPIYMDGEELPFYELSDLPDFKPQIQEFAENPYWCNKRGGYGSYINIPCSFDIETTTCNIGSADEPKWIGFMYHWQFGLDTYMFHGRYWEEFTEFLDKIRQYMRLGSVFKRDVRLPIYSHFASFEFQHLRNFINVESVFARKKRIILKAQFDGAYELRCSWALSNMGLGKFIENTPNARFNKQSGDDFDYLKLRLPSTPMTNDELLYCYCDVAGLNECIRHAMKEDNLAEIPMTSTGYLRRECRKAVLKNPRNNKEVQNMALSPNLYVLCKSASRGGNCHANAYFTNVILDDVDSWDRKSSYPAEMVVDLYPMSRFEEVMPTEDNLYSYQQEGYAELLVLTFWGVKCKETLSLPYIPIAKCIQISPKPLIDNGRVVEAKYVTMVITDIDFKIIMSHYKVSSIELSHIYIAKYGHLNDEFRHSLMEMFYQKCLLETGDQYLYNKFKNKINAYFGMMLTDICSPEIIYAPNTPDVWIKGDIDIASLLEKYYSSKKSFLSYQHGVWVTANARYRHQQGIDCVGEDVVYGDTDSVKYINNHDKDFTQLNAEWLAICERNDINPTVFANGKYTTLGVWEKEKHCDQFVTLGAKKYACIAPNKKGVKCIQITVAGLNKDKGAKYLTEHGGLADFKPDTVVPAKFSGRTTSHYIDVDRPYKLTINGETFTTGSSIAVVPTTYEFGVTEEYLKYFTSIQ